MSGQSAEEIEKEEAAVADGRLDIIGEDPQEDHVADEVHPAAVQEHAGDEGEEVLAPDGFLRYGAVVEDKRVQFPGRQGGLKKKDGHVEHNKPVAEDGEVPAFDLIVANWKKHILVVVVFI